MAITQVQTPIALGNASALAVTPTFGSSVTAGNLIVVTTRCLTVNAPATPTMVGETFILAQTFNWDNVTSAIYYAYNAVGGQTVVTVTAGGLGRIGATIREYAGAATATDPIGTLASGSALTGTTMTTSSSVTMARDGVIVSTYAGSSATFPVTIDANYGNNISETNGRQGSCDFITTATTNTPTHTASASSSTSCSATAFYVPVSSSVFTNSQAFII